MERKFWRTNSTRFDRSFIVNLPNVARSLAVYALVLVTVS